jgi:hypothetical protein
MLVSSRTVRLVGRAFVVVAALAAAGCGAHHRTMQDAVLYASCGDRCKHVEVRLSNVRRVEHYATADVTSKPPGHVPGAHVVLHRVNGDWDFVDAWTSLNGLACAEVARQMRVPRSILHRLSVC